MPKKCAAGIQYRHGKGTGIHIPVPWFSKPADGHCDQTRTDPRELNTPNTFSSQITKMMTTTALRMLLIFLSIGI